MGICLRSAVILMTVCLASGAAGAAEPHRAPEIVAALRGLADGAAPHPEPRWRAALARIEADRARTERCLAERPCRDILAKPLADIVRRLSGAEGPSLLAAVNRHYNSFPYQADRAAQRPSDDWASPLSFLQRSGDCEDFAIAKYLTLRLLGVPETKMAVLVMRDAARRSDHAVLVVREGTRLLVLDNLRELAPLEEYRDYRPLLALTASASWRLESPKRTLAQPLPAAQQ